MPVGYRARIGLVVPSPNTTVEAEYYRVAPAGVTFHSDRMVFAQFTADDYKSMVADVRQGVRYLAHAHVATVAFACTSGSLFGGPGYDRQIIDLMEGEAGVACTTTSTAVVEALRVRGMEKVAVVTPYPDWVNAKVQTFLEGHDFTVLERQGLELPENEFFGRDACERITSISPEILYPFVRQLASLGQVDGVFLSCTALRTLEVLERLEQDLGLPVVSSNQATLWKTLALAGIDDPIGGWGELLRLPRVKQAGVKTAMVT